VGWIQVPGSLSETATLGGPTSSGPPEGWTYISTSVGSVKDGPYCEPHEVIERRIAQVMAMWPRRAVHEEHADELMRGVGRDADHDVKRKRQTPGSLPAVLSFLGSAAGPGPPRQPSDFRPGAVGAPRNTIAAIIQRAARCGANHRRDGGTGRQRDGDKGDDRGHQGPGRGKTVANNYRLFKSQT
jgi:hypothetical protein